MGTSIGFDPRSAQIDSVASEPALPGQALGHASVQAIFERAREEPGFPRWQPELLRDRRRPLIPVTDETAIRASVLVTLVGSDPLSMVLTERTTHLSSHAGQISFPGGRAEASDQNETMTALREAREEIGIDPSSVSVLGRLPDYFTATGFRVTPVIGWASLPDRLMPDPEEVADIFTVPLSFLMNPRHHQVRVVPADQSPTGETIRFYAMPYPSPAHDQREFFIWGATAAMIRNLYHFLAAGLAQADS